jgi:HEPN domain-containing protein
LPRKTDSNNPAHWLAIAEDELNCIRLLVGQGVGHDMCQSKLAEILEKVLKAELLRQGWFLEKTHDLERLRKELRTRDTQLASQLEPLCTSLAEVYFTGRYPGFDLEDYDWPTLRSHLEQVSQSLAVVKARVLGS